jgi:hypothetical protein
MKTTLNITHPAFALFTFACFALAPDVRAVCQQGCGINNNTFLGDGALINNTSGVGNTAVGFNALLTNNDGLSNTATGYQALKNNTTGGGNTANGNQALASNNTASSNSAFGNNALAFNIGGSANTATGSFALNRNQNGGSNTATGDSALIQNTGSSNTAIGSQAGANLTSGSNNIDIGANVLGLAGEANTIRIGKNLPPQTPQKTFIGGIYGRTAASGVGVFVGPTGQLGTVVSARSLTAELFRVSSTNRPKPETRLQCVSSPARREQSGP